MADSPVADLVRIRKAVLPADFEAILSVINDGATAYKGVLPDEVYSPNGAPYMVAEELRTDIEEAGIQFYVAELSQSAAGNSGCEIAGVSTLARQPLRSVSKLW